MKLKFANALSLALIMAMLFTSVGLADNVVNDVAVSNPNGVTLIAGDPGTATVGFKVVATGGDSDTACNIDSGESLTITINTPAGVTASPASLTFTTCGGFVPVTFAADLSGTSGIVSVAITGNSTGVGTYNLNPATFPITVNAPPPPANTPPSVSVTGVTDGASYSKGSVPAATCQVTDAEDGNSSFAATLSAITGTYASDGIGSQTASCSYTDGGGLSASASATYSIVDPSAPSIGYTLNPASPDGSNSWYKSSVTLTWNVSEPESPNSLSKTGCADQNITADQAETSYSCSATSAGGSAGPVEVTIMRDATVPTISGSASPAANGAGWNNTDVTVSFLCNDNLSGVASCGPNQTLSGEGTSQSATGNALDNAGNSASATVSGINIDKTAPVVAVTGVADGAQYTLGSVPAAGCSTNDALSGVETFASLSTSGGPVGFITATCGGAFDYAGNAGNTASVTYQVIYAWNGFFQPVDNNAVNTVKAGSAIPVKFSLGGNQGLNIFATDYPKLVKTSCTSGVPEDAIETTVTAGGSSLTYDALAGQYIYVWKTEKSWIGWCGQLQVKLIDGTTHTALFKFK